MNNRTACRHWADRLSEALKAGAVLEAKLREMAGRDPTDAECDPLIKQAESAVAWLLNDQNLIHWHSCAEVVEDGWLPVNDGAVRELLYGLIRWHIEVEKAGGGDIVSNAIPAALKILGWGDGYAANSRLTANRFK
jgi:hypothetical protein